MKRYNGILLAASIFNGSTTMKHRQLRLNELVKRELSALIVRQINFEGVLVSINAVDVTPDLKNAHVFVSILGAATGASVIDKLEAHRPLLQAELSRHVVLKYTPHLIFHIDDSIKRGTRVLEILQDLEKPRGENE
ncbi:MAG: 30S ribosome-binding factor RbfA [Candidatus Udaeobacter sp.]